MLCSAEPPIKLTIHSSDANLISTNIALNAHPQTKISRLLQYIHSIISSQGDTTLQHVSKYCLKHDGQELPLDSTLITILASHIASAFIPLDFEQLERLSEENSDLDYNYESEFSKTDLEIEVNILARDKIQKRKFTDIRVDITMAKLEKMALELVNDLELTSDNEGYCSMVNQHSLDSIIGFKIKGQDQSIPLDNSNDFYMDYSLLQLLNFDLLPEKTSCFALMFQVEHTQKITNPSSDVMTLELFCNDKLSISKLKVDSSTSVEDVKNFICCIYMQSSNVTPDNVKLIYRGQLIPNKTLTGHPATIKSYINEFHAGKLHVQVAQYNSITLDKFWSEPFQHSNENISIVDPSDRPIHVTADRFMNEQQGSTYEAREPVRSKYVTESGKIVQPQKGLYRKCLVDGREVFIEEKYLDPVTTMLVTSDAFFSLSTQDYRMEGNIVRLSPSKIQEIEQKLNIKIVKENIPQISTIRRNDQRSFFRYVRNIIPFIVLAAKTVYLVGRNSFLTFFIMVEFGAFLSWKYRILLLVVLLCRTIWVTREIRVMWSHFLRLNDMEDKILLQLKEYSNSDQLDNDFYVNKIEKNTHIMDLFLLPQLQEKRNELYEKYGGDATRDASSLKEIFRLIQSETIPIDSLNDLLCNVVGLYDVKSTLTTEQQYSLKEFLNILYRDMSRLTLNELSLPRRIFEKIQLRIDSIEGNDLFGNVMRKIVPNRLHDNVIITVLKNFVLFFFLFLPGPIRNKVDEIIQEQIRVRERMQHEEQENEAASHNQDNVSASDVNSTIHEDLVEEVIDNDLASTQNDVSTSTGIDLHRGQVD
ncbi:hypothetical protein KAFR_0C05620 [Kazachstania africana CBS 2517]|uniref:Ubiquitin-like domain-containing protein n=1 Tax=Kazachstania africana (strain ATCC 22294 / BCRC 22015 / CBS 2517 / CECT 1963 / NBRC 1671 / NRRL Y-8276) TaxID=1071382 RepID=H2AT53_KAZAF|nr:hypothetical protein KAFR_0C05620 [Kazachstania africana CBS 2517]CCF57553.1 hypothetical protein KAFR_0C05620 [Kazachstania africana CBS 2517]